MKTMSDAKILLLRYVDELITHLLLSGHQVRCYHDTNDVTYFKVSDLNLNSIMYRRLL